MSVSEQVHVGIRPVFIDTFLGSGVSVSEQLGIRPVFIDIFLGRAMSVSEQVAGIKLGGNLGEIVVLGAEISPLIGLREKWESP